VTLAYSGDGKSSQVISSSADSRTALPFALPTKTKSALPKADLKTVSANPLPWIPNASFVTPGNTAVILNTGIIVIYEITFYNDCPQSTVLMHLHVWDNFLIYDPCDWPAGLPYAWHLGQPDLQPGQTPCQVRLQQTVGRPLQLAEPIVLWHLVRTLPKPNQLLQLH
jgi:hypothetical protein